MICATRKVSDHSTSKSREGGAVGRFSLRTQPLERERPRTLKPCSVPTRSCFERLEIPSFRIRRTCPGHARISRFGSRSCICANEDGLQQAVQGFLGEV